MLLTRLTLTLVIAASLTAGCSLGQEDDYFRQADYYFEKGQYRKAVESLDSYLAHYPKGSRRSEALFRAGEIYYYTLNDKSEAVRVLGRLVAEFPLSDRSFQAREMMADLFRRQAGYYKQALLEYKWMANQRPDSPRAPYYWLEAARTYLMAGESEKAILELGALMELYPDSEVIEEAYIELGSTYLNLEQYQVALFIFYRFIEKYPDTSRDREVKFMIGHILEEMSLFQEALQVYNRLLDSHDNLEAVRIRIKGLKERLKKKTARAKEINYDHLPEMTPEVINNPLKLP